MKIYIENLYNQRFLCSEKTYGASLYKRDN